MKVITCTWEVNENLKNKTKYTHDSLEIKYINEKIHIYMIFFIIFSPKYKGSSSWRHIKCEVSVKILNVLFHPGGYLESQMDRLNG